MVTAMEVTACSTPVIVNTGAGGQDGLLVFVDKQLVAVLVLMCANHDADATLHGKWFLEAGFGPCQDWNKGQIFATRDDALAWVRTQVVTDHLEA
ncbi:hypothetical protein [Methylobacterium isbiliense]|jgi:hypothetical protein|uniref:Uncharacterized protein n=1 Tax=Methylobacterium isbiliense TaxID=315478 RepID=A0ABQ4S8V3_9HYPH|nr:hypothetical protein [Methylobacterium isbiliense]MDN3621865.1 hypothetical protein [Methylobacterium isbiliense]GJD99621.1 hypothetical protein GMJLKIPL_1539 [Methylobacterium isbiliense]